MVTKNVRGMVDLSEKRTDILFVRKEEYRFSFQ